MNYCGYSSTKPSDFEWLGAIPQEWDASLVKRWYCVTLGKMLQPNQLSPLDTEEPYLRAANITWSGVDISDVRSMWFTPYDKLKYRLAQGDLLVSEGGDVGRSAIWDGAIEECYFQNAINRIRERSGGNNRFLYYWMHFLKHIGYIDLICNKSTIAHYTAEKVQDSPCICPSPEEQYAIANFLDRETAKIDTLIDKQEKLIKLLEEKRQAVISHAVTKGLNPDVRMKDSGVEWLGEVPEHWTVTKFGFVKTVLTDFTANGSFADLKKNVEYLEGSGYARLIRLTDLRKNLTESGIWINELAYNYLSKSALFGGEFLLANVGAYAGLFWQMPEVKYPASLAPNMFMAKFDTKKVSQDFMAVIGQSHPVFSQLRLSATSSAAQPKLNKDDFKAIRFAHPDLKEQCEIVEHIEAETDGLNQIIQQSEKAKQLLKERRTALISAAVTGKIDVRNVA
jgi:type I restriction enzyme S subunit